MEIHKPKAAHSWREFLIEIGTIICGILIALGLEQVVESAHRRAEVREAREALREEIAQNLWRLQFGVEEDKCIDRSAAAYEAWARGGPKPPTYRMYSPMVLTSTWETVKSGAVPHMPLNERLALAAFYDQLAQERASIQLKRDAGTALIEIGNHDRLSPVASERILDAVGLERLQSRSQVAAAQRILALAADAPLSVRSPAFAPAARKALAWVCGDGDQTTPIIPVK